MAKRKYTPTQKPPPLEQQPLTPKRPKVKVDPEPIYEGEEHDEQEEEESQDFIDAYMDGDNDGGENVDEDDDAEENNAEDTNEDEEVRKRDLSNKPRRERY